ncbi:MAG: phosphoribosylformylglycinamidine cyclo-ligase [Chitinivibrionia bacterium]|nr:phosphoribosylformylglycinamidine cyclo-ligase [Chitinivibrionia bacterium]
MKYEDSGVSIDKAQAIKKDIARNIKSTWGPQVLSEVGNFGGLFKLGSYRDPVLVSSVDGVGTKLLVAKMAHRHDTVGQDLVNHCVNDILVQGAKPLFFLDYIAAGSLDPRIVADIIRGLAAACGENGCALIAGETAEMPGVYKPDDLDLAGCIVGVVEAGSIVDGGRIVPGDRVYALPSTGLHTNGYSLARKVFFDLLAWSVDTYVQEFGCTAGEELLKVHRSYLHDMTALMKTVDVKGMAHITGGGLLDNLPRILPPSCDAVVRRGSWPVQPVFRILQEEGEVEEREMYHTFNMGLGMVFICSASDGAKVMEGKAGAFHIGEIQSGRNEVVLA